MLLSFKLCYIDESILKYVNKYVQIILNKNYPNIINRYDHNFTDNELRCISNLIKNIIIFLINKYSCKFKLKVNNIAELNSLDIYLRSFHMKDKNYISYKFQLNYYIKNNDNIALSNICDKYIRITGNPLIIYINNISFDNLKLINKDGYAMLNNITCLNKMKLRKLYLHTYRINHSTQEFNFDKHNSICYNKLCNNQSCKIKNLHIFDLQEDKKRIPNDNKPYQIKYNLLFLYLCKNIRYEKVLGIFTCNADILINSMFKMKDDDYNNRLKQLLYDKNNFITSLNLPLNTSIINCFKNNILYLDTNSKIKLIKIIYIYKYYFGNHQLTNLLMNKIIGTNI